MKYIIFALAWIFITVSSTSAIKLSEVLAAPPVGKQLGKWKASEFVSDYLVGKIFAVPSEQRKVWQLRFFTFEDRGKALEKKNTFAEFVKKFGLEDLQSKTDAMPYNDGTLHAFTYKDANDFLTEKGKDPLPEGVYFVISFREVMK
ncbi:MAG: hypothetical protein H0X26_04460 [Alphaproteobacteria bacterium]|nr:hypothetical protein [Alphaproteobacteria bacterium]